MKYIRKPVIIDAFQYDGDLKGSDGKYYVPDWAVKAIDEGELHYNSSGMLIVNTESLRSVVHATDYVIKDKLKGINVMFKETFESMYDPVKEPHEINIETYQSITGIILKAEPAVRIGELNYTATEHQPQTGERREQGYRMCYKGGVMAWMDKTEFEMRHKKVLFPKKV
jgi:hypothetical protein